MGFTPWSLDIVSSIEPQQNLEFSDIQAIEKIVLIDEYDADDESSMSDNNTSAFNYREIAASSKLSRHVLGFAIDINPRYNPMSRRRMGSFL